MKQEFFTITTFKSITKSQLKLDLQHEGYTNIRYSGKLRGFYAEK